MIERSQVSWLENVWPKQAEWFVIGGLGRDNEAQFVSSKWPKVRVLGVEPNPLIAQMQRTGKNLHYTDERFPGRVIEAALWSEDNLKLTFEVPGPNGTDETRGSVCRPHDSPDLGWWKPRTMLEVPSRTLDSLSEEYGPFRNVVLWLDIEYAEIPALRGASKVLDEALLVNLELHHGRLLEASVILAQHGLVLERIWNAAIDPTKDATDFLFARR